MAAAFVATNGNGLARTASTTLTFTTTRDIQTGERVVCVATTRSNGSPPVTGITVGALALSLDKAITATEYVSIWSANNAGALIPTGTTVTVTVSGTNLGAKWAVCFSLSGVDTTTPVRTTTSAGATSTNPDPGATDATPQAGDVAVGGACTTGSTLPTAGAGYTVIVRQSEATNGSTHDSEYQNLAASGSTDANWTLASTTWAAACVVYAAASGVTYTDAPAGTITLSGSTTDNKTTVDAEAGTVTLSGSALDTHTYTDTAAGTIVLSGSVSEVYSVAGVDQPAGTIRLGGSSFDTYTQGSGGHSVIRATAAISRTPAAVAVAARLGAIAAVSSSPAAAAITPSN